VDMRYGEQIFEIGVPLDGLDLNSPDVMKEVVERFHRRHEELYTYSMRDRDTLLVNARVPWSGNCRTAEGARTPRAPASASRELRRAYFSKWREVPVFDLDTLAKGRRLRSRNRRGGDDNRAAALRRIWRP